MIRKWYACHAHLIFSCVIGMDFNQDNKPGNLELGPSYYRPQSFLILYLTKDLFILYVNDSTNILNCRVF